MPQSGGGDFLRGKPTEDEHEARDSDSPPVHAPPCESSLPGDGDARKKDLPWAFGRAITRHEELRGDALVKYRALVDYLRAWCVPKNIRASRSIDPVILRGPPGCGKGSMLEAAHASGDLPNVQFVDGGTLSMRDCMHRMVAGGILPGENCRGVLVIRHASERTVRIVQDARSEIYAGTGRTHKRKRGGKSGSSRHPKMIPVMLVTTSPGTVASDWRKNHHLVDLRAHHVEDLVEIAKATLSSLRADGHIVPLVPRHRMQACITDALGDARRLINALQTSFALEDVGQDARVVSASTAVEDEQSLARRLFGSYLTAAEWSETYDRHFPRSIEIVMNEYTAALQGRRHTHGREEDHIANGSVADELGILGLVDIMRRRSTPLSNALVAALLSPTRRGCEGSSRRGNFPGASSLWISNHQRKNDSPGLCRWSEGGMEPPGSILRGGQSKGAHNTAVSPGTVPGTWARQGGGPRV